jgi:hypothetical protein
MIWNPTKDYAGAMPQHSHQTAPTQIVNTAGVRFAYPRFGKSTGVPLVFNMAVFNIGVTGTDATIKIVDHWTLRDGKAISLWAANFEPQAVLEKLGIKLAVDGGMNA